MNNYAARCLTGILTLLIAAATGTAAQEGVQDGDWPSYGGDKGSTKYSNLDQIDRDNFAELETAWTWRSIDVEVQKLPGVRVRPQEFKSTPLMANGVFVHEHVVQSGRRDRCGYRRDPLDARPRKLA